MPDQKIMWVALLIFFAWLGDILLAHAEQLYVDSKIGHDANSGTLAEPLQTIEEAMRRVNSASKAGPSLIGIAPGVYVLQRTVVFENKRPYTDRDRLTVEATVLPGDAEWKPNLMPVIRLAHTINMPTETQSFQIRMDHVTIRGLKFLGNPVATNYHIAIDRTGGALDDLIVTQCLLWGMKRRVTYTARLLVLETELLSITASSLVVITLSCSGMALRAWVDPGM